MTTVSVSFNEPSELSKHLNEPKWLLDYRNKNAKIVEQRPLKKSKYLNLTKLEEMLIKPTNGKTVLPTYLEEKNVKVFSWEKAIKEIPEKIKEVLEKEHSPKDQFEAFINSWFNTGFVLVIGNEVKEEKLVYESVFGSDAIGKILVIIENDEREVKILEKLRAKERFFLNETIWLAQNCKASFLQSLEDEENAYAFLFSQTILEKDSTLLHSNAWLVGELVRSNTYNNLIGTGSKLTHLDLMFLNGKQLFDINNTVIHTASDSTSFTEIKSVLTQHSKNVFDGMIKIPVTGQRTHALLEAHSMILSEDASSNNIPGLEIEADDVSATHSASVVQILDEQIFYLETRGIKKEIAKQLMVTSFLESIIFKLPKEYHSELFSAVEQKINKTISDDAYA